MVKIKKIYYIEQVIELTDLNENEIKEIEDEGLIEKREENNVRFFYDEDIEKLQLIKRLKDELEINLAGIDVILNMREKLIELQENFIDFIQIIKEELKKDKNYLMNKSPDDIMLKTHGKIEPFKKE